MKNFQFYNPVRILFVKGQIAALTAQIPAGAKGLVTYGGGSIKQNGGYDPGKEAPAGWRTGEFAGAKARPK